ncbi:MAG: mycothiol system anti-sigma-R factor [Gemmatimonadota bacterium]
MTSEGINCRATMDRLWALLDSELDAPTAAQVREHLDACQHCYPQYDFHRAYRDFVAGRCRHEAPPEVRRRIFMSLLAEEGRGPDADE